MTFALGTYRPQNTRKPLPLPSTYPHKQSYLTHSSASTETIIEAAADASDDKTVSHHKTDACYPGVMSVFFHTHVPILTAHALHRAMELHFSVRVFARLKGVRLVVGEPPNLEDHEDTWGSIALRWVGFRPSASLLMYATSMFPRQRACNLGFGDFCRGCCKGSTADLGANIAHSRFADDPFREMF